MNPALAVVDVQHDFLDRPGLVPPAAQITAGVAALLAGCRQRGVPVVHVQTVISADGHDRMPHWQRAGHWACVEGQPGALPPPAVAPLPGEEVVRKPFFSAFGDPRFGEWLGALRTDLLIVAGIYLHGCVRSTVLDAYERGFEVWVADDATGSTEPEHAAHTRNWLGSRAAAFLTVAGVLERLDAAAPRRAGSA